VITIFLRVRTIQNGIITDITDTVIAEIGLRTSAGSVVSVMSVINSRFHRRASVDMSDAGDDGGNRATAKKL
jgi:hypothetical protein